MSSIIYPILTIEDGNDENSYFNIGEMGNEQKEFADVQNGPKKKQYTPFLCETNNANFMIECEIEGKHCMLQKVGFEKNKLMMYYYISGNENVQSKYFNVSKCSCPYK